MMKETLLDFATHVLQVSDTTYNENEISVLPRVSYEFPNGYNTDFGEERYRIPEALFNPSILKVSNSITNKITLSENVLVLYFNRESKQTVCLM